MMETREVLHLIVACGSLHVLWDDIAEIRALAIHPEYQHLGLGSKLVESLIEDAKKLGIKRVYTFTFTEEFFRTIGFKRQKREALCYSVHPVYDCGENARNEQRKNLDYI